MAARAFSIVPASIVPSASPHATWNNDDDNQRGSGRGAADLLHDALPGCSGFPAAGGAGAGGRHGIHERDRVRQTGKGGDLRHKRTQISAHVLPLPEQLQVLVDMI